MMLLIWHAPLRYFSKGDEAAFFSWLQAIPGVIDVQGVGRELHIRLRSKRLSAHSLREFIALYQRYQGEMSELALFVNNSNAAWFANPGAYWFSLVFGSERSAWSVVKMNSIDS